MTNQIRLKRGSGSNPSASDLAVGEIAIRTDTGVLFTKDDGGSVITLGGSGSGVQDGDKGDITVSNTGDTWTIDNDAVTLAKMQNVITDSILGRTTNGTGNLEVLSAASVRGIINVENGATADQTASEILTLLKTVDGTGSGLDADTLDGISSASFLRSDTNTLLNGILTIGGSSVSSGEGGEFRLTYAPNGSLSGSNLTVDVNNNNFRIFEDGGNNRGVFIDLTTCSNSASGKLYHNGNDGSGSGLDADLLDGQEGSYYRNAGNINAGTLAAARLPNHSAALLTSGTLPAARLPNHSASLLTSGTIPAARVPTLNQNTTGSAATLTTARTIAGVSFDGSANISLNNNAITNGAGYITSADGGNAATLDGIDSSSFLRSDANDTATGTLTVRDILVSSGYHLQRSNHHSGHLEGSYNNVGANSYKTNPIYSIGSGYNPNDAALNNFYGVGYTHTNASFISFTGASGWGFYVAADGDARVYLDGSNGVVSSTGQHYVGSNVVWNAGNDGASSGLDADLLDGQHGSYYSNYNNLSNKPTIPTNNNQLTNGAGYITSSSAGIPASGGTFTGDIAVSGGAGALTVNGNSDIRLTNGNWTGNAYGKIQHHSNALYISGGSSGDYSFIFRHNSNDRVYIKSNGTIWPTYNNSADLGLSNRRWANIYVQDMHFSNGEDNPNKVDGTWGDWTLQEGEDNVYMLNNRNGKKYKMNLTEIV